MMNTRNVLFSFLCFLVLLSPGKALAQGFDHIYFRTNSYAIEETEKEKLVNFAIHSHQQWAHTIRITGNCDSAGSYVYNEKLALLRAKEVQKFLIKNGMPASLKYILISNGKRKPVNDNSTENERWLNRRVDVELVADKIINDSNKSNQTEIKKLPGLFDTAKTGSRIILPGLNFYPGMHRLLPASTPVLDTIIRILKNHPALKIRIEGHVCCTANGEDGEDIETHVFNLSQTRARMVYEYLASHGISSNRMSYIGKAGKFHMVENEITEEDKIRNRRVEIQIIGR
jgi:outer membrane protein OmpA-like peptidoglycan-associated protein